MMYDAKPSEMEIGTPSSYNVKDKKTKLHAGIFTFLSVWRIYLGGNAGKSQSRKGGCA